MKNLVVGGVYQHYKGTKVKVLAEGLHSETLEPLVIYIHLEDGAIWARPKEMFLEKLMFEGKEVERFLEIKQEILVRPSEVISK
jgi:cyclomaltodextrinase / maltogenic alpha-amylase / neopullulanase